MDNSSSNGTALAAELIQVIDTIKSILRGKGITYGELSQKCGVPESTLKKIFMGKDFQLSQLFKITSALDIDPADLMRESEENVFHLTEEQESLFMSDLDSYRIFILLLRKTSLAEIEAKIGSGKQGLPSILKSLEGVGLIERLEENRIKLIPRGALQMNSESRFQKFLEEKAAYRLMAEFYQKNEADLTDTIRHVGSVRLRKKTLETIKSRYEEFNEFLLSASTRDVRLTSPEELVDVTYLLGLAPVGTYDLQVK